ncbi:N-acetyl-gamma-glutamyl-phosphate reductase [Paenibacillus albiflavus]|uniref:N-acetyl-gamma-glutamyl-phosphate reductase n=1 Tax=Paenibacillus albiflavus TaxID=2545760 RepID=A0A4V2WNU9_9BACL|nr:N-acetyl-gamma-glutamyl-phosphate reductase [Paenibacillus albiflavus]TCZ76862.1 N-acetyl-gamma-glutamyl-phosphate reductase [Paenibacillus albiflavus]
MKNKKTIRAAIVGATGYGGVELIRLLQAHPRVEITSVISSTNPGAEIIQGFPHLTNIMLGTLDAVDPQLIASKADVVFLATPAGVAVELAPQFLQVGLKVIDISGDYRLKSPELYEKWYKRTPADAALLEEAVYGLCEVWGMEVNDTVRLLSNPGCFPTAILLGLIPAVAAGWIDLNTIIIDAKSGVSGAGRGLSLSSHFAEVNENFSAYKLNKHQHIPEIEQALTRVAGKPVVTTLTTHLVPMNRGIMATMYASVAEEARTDADFVNLYNQYYEDRPFVRVRKAGTWPATKHVTGSNYCDIGFAVDERTGRVTIISVIDNVVKGAAGQAIQNLNLMMGWDESTGLMFAPMYP